MYFLYLNRLFLQMSDLDRVVYTLAKPAVGLGTGSVVVVRYQASLFI